MSVDTKTIVQLRDMTGAGIADCKKALEEVGGDIDKAIDFLRQKGEIKAAKKSAERVTKEGLVGAYIHGAGKVGVLVSVACETDFVAKTDDFIALVRDLGMQIAAMAPTYVSPYQIPNEVLEREKAIYQEQLAQEGKPEAMWDKIMAGKLAKFYEDVCLLNQSYIKDDSRKVGEMVNAMIAKTGEKIEVKEFARFQV